MLPEQAIRNLSCNLSRSNLKPTPPMLYAVFIERYLDANQNPQTLTGSAWREAWAAKADRGKI